MNDFTGNLSKLARISHAKSRSISAENFKGEAGKGGMATEGTGKNCARELGPGWKISPAVVIKPGEVFELAAIDGPGVIRHIWITENSPRNRALILRMYWEGNDKPSVETPLGDFFAAADCQEYRQLTSIPVCVNPRRAFNCYWEMPFKTSCRITLENICDEDLMVFYQIDYTLEDVPEDCAYFHAQFRRVNPLPYKSVYTIVDGIEGRGQYVGTYMFWGVNNDGWWGEGEIKFYMDDDGEFPTICGTGTEDYFCGSWNFDVNGKYTEFCTPYVGMYKVMRPDGAYRANQRFSMYRWHIPDPIHFEKKLRVTIQALGWRSGGRYLPLQDDIASVAFWYQDTPATNFPPLPSKDELEII